MRRKTLTIRRSRIGLQLLQVELSGGAGLSGPRQSGLSGIVRLWSTKTRTIWSKTRTIRTRSLTTGKKTLTLERSGAEKNEFLHFIFENNNLISINKHTLMFLSRIYATHITLYNDHEVRVVGMVCLHYI